MRYCPNCGAYPVFQDENLCAICGVRFEWIPVHKRRRIPNVPEEDYYIYPQPKARGEMATTNCTYCFAPLLGQSLGWVTEDYGLTRRICPVCHGEKVIARKNTTSIYV